MNSSFVRQQEVKPGIDWSCKSRSPLSGSFSSSIAVSSLFGVAPKVPHVVAVKALGCCFFSLCSMLAVTYRYKHTILPPPAESDRVGEFSSEDEEDIQVSPIDSY